jgi:acetyltransferase-like isoleucine patch superfamily enzyme
MAYFKTIIFYIVNLINIFFLRITGLVLKRSRCLFVNIKADRDSFRCFNSYLKSVRITINGSKNQLVCNSCHIESTSISITGTGNTVNIESGVVLRSSKLIVRGSNCAISIGKSSTFGGVRIIAVGEGSVIVIGENCLFSDNVELWASDTHPIYDEGSKVINPEGVINISDRVWVGSRAIILKNVTIGCDSVIGLATVVTKNVPESSVVVGNPGRVVQEGVTWGLEYPVKENNEDITRF